MPCGSFNQKASQKKNTVRRNNLLENHRNVF